MPAPPRPVIQPNTYYHIYNRGVNRRTIFKEEDDYLRFWKLIKKWIEPVGQVFSYALMRDHFHLTVMMYPAEQIPEKLLRKPHTLGNTFGHLQNAYAMYFNQKHKTVSGLFEKTFERKEVANLQYFRDLVVYHHLNPVKHGLETDFQHYRWTSYQEYANPLVESFIDVDLGFQKFGGREAFFTAHQTDLPLARTLDWE